MSVYPDVVEGGGRVTHSEDGITAVRAFRVDALDGDRFTRAASVLELGGIPRYGEPHPTIPGILCLNVEVEMSDVRQALVTCTYRRPTPRDAPDDGGGDDPGATSALEIGATVQTAKTNLDANGNLMIVSYVPSSGPVIARSQGGTVDIQIPSPVLSVSRRETVAPWLDALKYVGRTNRFRWNRGEERTWLCTSIRGTTDDGGVTYQTAREFAYKEETWDATVVYTDPKTGKPPSDVADFVNREFAIRKFQVYGTEDFAPMRISF